jgi:uncharacterized protein YndB with AHSA1/START domain
MQRTLTVATMGNHMAEYAFTTVWRVESPIEEVWQAIYHSEEWPRWWKGVERVEELKEGDGDGVGSVRRYTWKSRLPYRLTFEVVTVRVEPRRRLEGRAQGELEGAGIWTLTEEGSVTVVRYDWTVRTTKTWMNLLAPLARPVFRWNHDAVMRWGGEGLAILLGTRLVN